MRKEVEHINAYLIERPDEYVFLRECTIAGLPPLRVGNAARREGIALTEEENNTLGSSGSPESHYVRPYKNGRDLLYGTGSYCLYIPEGNTRDLPPTSRYVGSALNRKNPPQECVAFPVVFSSSRMYVPCSVQDTTVVLTSKGCHGIGGGWLFSILSSRCHRVWTELTCSKLKEDIAYSVRGVWNTFPAQVPKEREKVRLEEHAAVIQNVVASCDENLAYLYSPRTMPSALKEALRNNDRAVESTILGRECKTDEERLRCLLDKYKTLERRGSLFS